MQTCKYCIKSVWCKTTSGACMNVSALDNEVCAVIICVISVWYMLTAEVCMVWYRWWHMVAHQIYMSGSCIIMQNTCVFIISRRCGHQTRSHVYTHANGVVGSLGFCNAKESSSSVFEASWKIMKYECNRFGVLVEPWTCSKIYIYFFFCCESCLNDNHSAKQHVSSVFIPAIRYKGWKVEDLDLPPTFPVLLKSNRKLSLFIMTQFNGLLRFILQFVLKQRCFDGLWISASDFMVTCSVLIFNIFVLTIRPTHINCLLSITKTLSVKKYLYLYFYE